MFLVEMNLPFECRNKKTSFYPQELDDCAVPQVRNISSCAQKFHIFDGRDTKRIMILLELYTWDIGLFESVR